MHKVTIDNTHNIKEIEVDNSWARDLGKEYFEYRKKWNLSGQQQLFEFPLFLEVEVSYACNYRCPKCPRLALGHGAKVDFLSDELLDKLFKEAKIYKMPSVGLSHGGEPLMRKNICDIIRRARDSLILDCLIHTNGSLLNEDLSAELIESGLTKINFSLDAASVETYSKVRAGGDYDTVVKNINMFLKVRKKIGKSYPRVRVSFVVSRENKHEQERFYDLWKDKVNVIAFQKCYDFTKRINPDAIESRDHSELKFCCSRLWRLLTITYEGDIVVCEVDYSHDYTLGNLKTHTIYECWHSKMMDRLRGSHLQGQWHKLPVCRRCVNSVEHDKIEI